MPLRTEHVEVGTRVSYEDTANLRREGRVLEILEDGREFVVEWDPAFQFPAHDLTGPITGTTSDLCQHGWHIVTDLPGNPFDGADIIISYTRADAIRDGVLVPTPDLVPDEPDFARDAGWAVPVALTTAVANLAIPTQWERDRAQDVKGRLWDVLRMAATYGARRDANEWLFPCIFLLGSAAERQLPRAGRKTLHLKAVIGPDDDGSPVLTIMLPEED